MDTISQPRPFDLVVRTRTFGKDVRAFVKNLPSFPLIWDDTKQLLRSSASIGANYLEAQEAVSTKDFVHRVRISRKEARESIHWLDLLSATIPQADISKCLELKKEVEELTKILTTIIKKIELRLTKS